MIYKKDITDVYIAIEKEDQFKLYEEMKDGDLSARNEIINSCLPLVYKIANKFHINNKHIDLDDLIQQGNMSLIKAVDNWDINKSWITTLTTRYVTNSLIDMIKDSKYKMKTKYDITRQAAEDINKIKKTCSKNIEDISKETGLREKRVKYLLEIMQTKRVDFSTLGFNTDSIIENDTRGEIRGCIADIIDMLEQHVKNNQDKEIFLSWINYLNKTNKTRLISKKLNVSPDVVLSSIKNTKKILRQIVSEDISNV